MTVCQQSCGFLLRAQIIFSSLSAGAVKQASHTLNVVFIKIDMGLFVGLESMLIVLFGPPTWNCADSLWFSTSDDPMLED